MAWSYRPSTSLLLLLPLWGCPAPTPDDGGDDTSSSANPTSTSEASTESLGQTSEADTTAGSGSATGGGPAMCDGGGTYQAIAEVIDEGLGPTGAPVTLHNCTDALAYVRQDCCYGAAFMLERKDSAEDPWRTSQPSMDCDCEGFISPLMIEPQSSIVVDTHPAAFDSEPLCERPFSAIYRWTFLIGAEPDCDDCWVEVPTNDMNWYCEG